MPKTNKGFMPKTIESMLKIIFAAPKGPPYGGMTANTSAFMRSSIFKDNKAVLVNTSPPNRPYGVFYRFFHSLRLFRRLVKAIKTFKPNIVYFMSSSFRGFYEKGTMAILSQMMGARTVIHLIGGGFRDFYESSRFNSFLISFFLKRCDAVATVSECWKEFISSFIPSEKVWIIPNPVESKIFINKRDKIKKNHQVQILFSGKLVKNKGVLDLIDVVSSYRKEFQNTKVILMGDGELYDECKNNIQEAKIDNIVSMTGYVGEEEKILIFKASDIFVLPTYEDALPVAVLEALSAGLPVVSTIVGGIPSMVEHNENGFLVPPGDLDRFKNYLIQLIHNNELRSKMGRKGQEIVKSKFDIEIVAEKMNEMFHDLVSKKIRMRVE